MWNHTEIGTFITQNHDKWGRLSFTDFTFFTIGKRWNHIQAQESLVGILWGGMYLLTNTKGFKLFFYENTTTFKINAI